MTPVLILHDGQFFFARIIDFRTTLENRLRRVRWRLPLLMGTALAIALSILYDWLDVIYVNILFFTLPSWLQTRDEKRKLTQLLQKGSP